MPELGFAIWSCRIRYFTFKLRKIMKVVCQLSDILVKRNLSRRQLARQAGVTPNAIGNLVRTHFSSTPIVHLKTLSKVCVALDIAPGDLLKLEENT